MATEVGPQTRPAPRYEAFVEQQIARARRRIRALDAAAIGLVLLLAALTYALLMTCLDRALDFPAGARLLAFLVFAAAAVVYLGVAAYRLLARRVNPYYAARQIEQTLPDAKNSVVNWLDLRATNLPPAIRGALGQRAARDLKQADLDRAISTRRTTWLGTAALALFVILLVWLVAGGGQAFSLLQRAFAPFEEVAIASRTDLTLLQPEGGDVTVPLGRPVTFRVHVTGRVPRVNEPDALRLHYRYNPTDPYVEQNLEQDADGEWATALVADQVQSGLWYMIRGGDAQTPEYQVRVRAQAQVTGFDVKYHYRPYLHRADQVVHYPNEDAVAPHLRALRGTEVTVTAYANRPVRESSIEMDLGGVKKEITAEMLQPDTMRFHFPLERNGTYRVLFTGVDRDSNTDRSPYRIEVLTDRVPLVSLTKPGKDVELPSNGTLALEGKAEDDFGITKMTLRMQVKDGPALKPKVYREGKSFRLDNGNYPDKLDYKEFVALEKVHSDAGTPFTLVPGMEVKYWLEATDNSDYPDKSGNVGRSKEYTVKIIEPTSSPHQQQDRKQAQQAQQQHEQRQDQKLEKQNEQTKAAQQDGAGSDQQKGSEQNKSPSQKEFENKANQLAKAIQDKEKQDAGQDKEKQDAGQNKSKVDNTKSQDGNQQRGQDDKSANPSAAKEQSSSGGGNAQKNQGKDGQSSSTGNQANGQEQPQTSKSQQQQPGKDRGTGTDTQAGQNKDQKQDGSPAGKETQAGKQQDQKQDQAKGAGQNKSQPQAKDGATGKDAAQPQAQAGGAGKDKTQTKAKDGNKEQGTKGEAQGMKNEATAGNSSKGTDAKSNAQGQSPDAKTQGSAAQQAKDAGQSKNGSEQGSQGPSKRQQSGQAEETAKGNTTEAAGGQQKSASAKNGSGQPENNKSSSEKSQSADAGKGDRSSSASKEKDNTSSRDATQDDVARLKKALQDGKQQQQAADALSRVQAEARDPQVRKAAEDALKEAGAQAKEAAQNATKEDVSKLAEALKSGDQKQAAAEKLGKIASEGRDPQARKAAEEALKQADAASAKASQSQEKKADQGNGSRDSSDAAQVKGEKQRDPAGQSSAKEPGGAGAKKKDPNVEKGAGTATADAKSGKQGGAGGGSRTGDITDSQEKVQPQPVNEEFARRGGVLQLEDLKKKVTPDILKKLNWSDKDWQQFLDEARRYEAAQQKQPPLTAKDKLSSGPGVLPSTGPRQVRPGTDARSDDLSTGRALPPPEFREAQNTFTSRPEGKK
jgi:collagen type III alpha